MSTRPDLGCETARARAGGIFRQLVSSFESFWDELYRLKNVENSVDELGIWTFF